MRTSTNDLGYSAAGDAVKIRSARILREQFRDVPPGGRRRQRPAVAPGELNPLIDDLAQFPVDFGFVRAVATSAYDAGTLANECLIFVGPFHDFHVAGTISQCCDSSIASLTSRS